MLLIGSAAAVNALHAWELGALRSEFHSIAFAAASIGGALMLPLAIVAALESFRARRWGFGLSALLLAAVCLAYSCAASLSATATSRSLAVAARTGDADAYTSAKARHDAAVAAMKALPPERVARFNELQAVVKSAASEMRQHKATGDTDPQASALAAYLAALGWNVAPERIGPWLMLLAVAFFELGAALSLTVARALSAQPQRLERVSNAAELPASAPAPLEAPRAVSGDAGKHADVVEAIRRNGGQVKGKLDVVSKIIGKGSKTAAHRALHALALAGTVALVTKPDGIEATLL
jgi:hypothetical protein